MDDFINDLGSKPKTLVEEAWHTEQERKKYDVIRVHNPTDKDFFVEYNTNQFQKIEAKSNKDVPRYIADRYLVHMTDNIINTMGKNMHDEQLAERDKKGLPRYTDKYVENIETYLGSNYPKTDNVDLRVKIAEELWVGEVSKVGTDRPPEDPRSKEVFTPSVTQRVMDVINKKIVPPQNLSESSEVTPSNPFTQRPTTNFSTMKEKLSVDDVTQE